MYKEIRDNSRLSDVEGTRYHYVSTYITQCGYFADRQGFLFNEINDHVYIRNMQMFVISSDCADAYFAA